MPSKELLLVRLRVSGLGLEPRWLLKRLQNYIWFIALQPNSPHQVIRKAEEKVATVEADKVKEESLTVAGGRCRKRVWLRALQKTGEFNICFFFFMDWKIKLPCCVFFRDLGPAHRHPSSHCDLFSSCHWLLHGCLKKIWRQTKCDKSHTYMLSVLIMLLMYVLSMFNVTNVLCEFRQCCYCFKQKTVPAD